MVTDVTSRTSVEYPPIYFAADSASLRAQRRSVRLVGLDLVLVIAASFSFLGAGLVTEPWLQWQLLEGPLVLLGSVCILGTLAAEMARDRIVPERDWYAGRALAETVKSASWRYLMRAEPFQSDDADARFIDVLSETLATHSEHSTLTEWLTPDALQISQGIRRLRAVSLSERRSIFIAERLVDQIEWYRTKSITSSRSAARWSAIGLLARAAALVAAVFNVIQLSAKQRWPSVAETALTVAAAATAWMQVKRHQELGEGYRLAATELIRQRSRVESVKDEETFGRAAADAEGAIGSEYTKWAARRI